MNNPNVNTNIGQEEVVPPAVQPPVKTNFLTQISAKIPQRVKDSFAKFYANKKVFLPVVVAGSLLLLTLIIGIIFGSRNKTAPKVVASPTPAPEVTTSPVTGGNTETQLGALKDQINNLDVSQRRLQPPTINFKISF